MKISQLKIESLYGIEQLELDGKSIELTGSNGVGKSSVLDAIRLALTNNSKRKYIVKKFFSLFNFSIIFFNSNFRELKKIMEKLNKLKNFLKIYFKIYEQKGNEYCLNVIKFKIYNFDDYELKEIFEIYYKDTLYEELSKDLKDEVDKILIDKFQIYI